MKFPFVVVSRKELDESRTVLVRKNAGLESELKAARSSALGADQANGKEILRLNERLLQSASMSASQQSIIASLRTDLADTKLALKEERESARMERQALMDWVAKGVSGGTAIFKDPPPSVMDAEAEKKPDPLKDVVPNELAETISRVGRKPRQIVNHISKKNEISFEETMAVAGVRRKFADDKVEAEVEAAIIQEETAQTA